jgi:hypothetical protein
MSLFKAKSRERHWFGIRCLGTRFDNFDKRVVGKNIEIRYFDSRVGKRTAAQESTEPQKGEHEHQSKSTDFLADIFHGSNEQVYCRSFERASEHRLCENSPEYIRNFLELY